MNKIFRKLSNKVSNIAGSAGMFVFAFLIVLFWALTGPLFSFSDTWQLVINTGTTIVTFLMVFLIQNTQNRDGKAVQLKLDELIRSTKARDAFVGLEELTDEEIKALNAEFRELHEKQQTSNTFKRLHRKIEEEHERRRTLRSQATSVINKLSGLNKAKSVDKP
jgi:low affinity Fe/Cu permease